MAGYKPRTREIYQSGEFLIEELEHRGVVFAGMDVLDVGCGNARWAVPLMYRKVKWYTGLDIIPGCINFCEILFQGISGFEFKLLQAHSSRYITHDIKAENAIFPVSGRYDIGIASSLFTHMEDLPSAKNYLDQFRKALKPGGWLFSSWFLNPPNELSTPEDRGARTVYHEKDVLDMLEPIGTITDMWDGHTAGYNDQRKILVKVS